MGRAPTRARHAVVVGVLLVTGLAPTSGAVAASTPERCDPARTHGAHGAPGTNGASARVAGTARSVEARSGGDAQAVPEGVRRRVQRDLERRLGRRRDDGAAATSMRGSIPADLVVRVPVHVHVVDGTRPADVRGPGRRQVRRQLRVLRDAFAGGQAGGSAATPFRFRLASYERVEQRLWHRARTDGRAERRMMRQLHAGGPRALNLFLTEPRSSPRDIALGNATFPWEAARRPRTDGVVVHTATLPGSRTRTAAGYDRGDSAVHEVGHWLGLFHTFEGGCDEVGDMVDDTPRAASPSYRCESGRDTCPTSPGKDSVRNFMNYSQDSCMDRFTPDQVDRMTSVWLAYRTQ